MNFQPLRDMILVKPDPPADKDGSVWIPRGAVKPGHEPGPSRECFTGTVVAVGQGDRVNEKVVPDGLGQRTVRRLIYADGSPAPMLTKVGDRVVYPRRPSMPGGEFSITIDGEMYVMFHEQQFAFAVIDD